MSPVHTYGMATDMKQSRGMAAEQGAVTATGSVREEVCHHIICLVTLLHDGIHTTSNFLRQGQCMPNAAHADVALVWSLARSLTIPMTAGIQMAGHLHNTVASPVRARPLRIALEALVEIITTLISDSPKATSLRQHNAMPRTTFSLRNLPAVVVPQLTKTRLTHHLINLVSVRRLLLRPLHCLHRKLHVSRTKYHRMVSAGSHHFRDRRHRLL